MKKHPCRKDCPERTAECKKTCSRLATYAASKADEYAAREMEYMIRDTEFKMNEKRRKRGCYLGSVTTPKHTGD